MNEQGAGGNHAIRRARMDDASALASLSRQLGYPATAEEVAARLGGVLDDPAQAVYVAETGGQPIGWVHAADVQTLESGRSAEIRGLVVEERHRGTGAGRALMEQAESWARARGCGRVRLRSNVIRSGAHAFYQRLGYKIVKTQHAFQKNLS